MAARIQKEIDLSYVPRKDMSGLVINQWTVLRPHGAIRSTYLYDGKSTTVTVGVYECRCKCGKVQTVRLDDLRQSKSKKCYDCAQSQIDRRSIEFKRKKTLSFKSKHAGQKHFWANLLPEIPAEYGIKLAKSAKARAIEFSLTAEDINEAWVRQKGLCAFSGIPLKFKHTDEMFAASVDRIDSSLGYQKENIQILSRKVNKMKWDLSQKDFLELISKILEHNRGR